MRAKSLQWCLTLYDPMGCTHQSPLSMGFSRQEYWSGLPFPPPGDFPDAGIEPASPALAGGFFTTSATWEAPRRVTPAHSNGLAVTSMIRQSQQLAALYWLLSVCSGFYKQTGTAPRWPCMPAHARVSDSQ